jgi:hypothetical protein
MTDLETVVRPFTAPDVAPLPFHTPGQQGAQPVLVSVGLKGGGKTFTWSASASRSTRMGNKHTEHAPASEALQNALADAAS